MSWSSTFLNKCLLIVESKDSVVKVQVICNVLLITRTCVPIRRNDVARRNYFSSNHFDAPKEILVTEARMSSLQHHAQKKRQYTKHNEEYWKTDI